ncbi:TIGR03087 family PEP-CTERM/XrtA system glycosyltransferase [Thalassotalea atypica]|uniref:TIGR03087 family PEP-CTERM/XrtA system glycosyltransferase n=1 Tax=Thalassotalea atypica TaxID=2054316 RepID=UPI002572B125|nr:TIGR03087 family PEP-CTERM/XrtA system glycosyltransferase [Thalassotalea atypica]
MSENNISKEPLLFLCHRIPFPPNKGDKIRSFNILKQLNQQFDVHLGCFIDDPFDKRYVEELKEHCKTLFTLDQNKTLAKIKGLRAFLSRQPITVPYYYDGKMQSWVDDVIADHKVNKIFVYSSSMAQYCQGEQYRDLERVIDFVDVDSDKWRQYAEKKSGIAKWIYQREHKLLGHIEDKICQTFNHSLFVSPDEAELFRERQNETDKAKVCGILNGVDVAFFDPEATFTDEPLRPKSSFISFTGAMDYWANIDAVVWFVEQVWPIILVKHPDAQFVIAGGNPSTEVIALAEVKGVIVTGRVVDVRPFIANAKCTVAPLRIARGIQNKVLEAMALDRPVVCTSMAMEGINAPNSEQIHIHDDANMFAQVCNKYLGDKEQVSNEECSNRNWILQQFTWKQTLQPLKELYSTKASEK